MFRMDIEGSVAGESNGNYQEDELQHSLKRLAHKLAGEVYEPKLEHLKSHQTKVRSTAERALATRSGASERP